MFKSNEVILIALIIVIIYLLCYNQESMTVSDKKLSARLDAQGIMQVENCCGRKQAEFCCGRKQERFNTPLDGLSSYDKAENSIVNTNLLKNSFYEKMASSKVIEDNNKQLIKLKKQLDYLQKNNRHFQNNKKISVIIATIFAINKQNAELSKTENCCGKQEHFGANPLDSLTTYDMTSAPFSHSEMEPMTSKKMKELKQENFEERYISDNRESNNGEQYIPNPENSFIIG